MTTSTHLALPYLSANQAQKHVTVNEALRLLDALVQGSVIDRDLTSPPGSPTDGDRYIVGSSATGAWSGWDDSVAYYVDGAWIEITPKNGWSLYVDDEAAWAIFDGANWKSASVPIGAATVASLNGGALGGLRNGFINGDFRVAQRGTSFAIASNNTLFYTADRWKARSGTGGACTVSVIDLTPGDIEELGFNPGKAVQFDQTTAASVSPGFSQLLEDVRSFAGQTVAISFWGRVTSGTLSVQPYRTQNVGSGGSSNASGNIGSAVTFTTSWQRFTVTVTIPSVLGKTIGADSYLQLWLLFATGVTFTAQIAGMQVEPGAVATPFEQRPLALEEALCRRYYQRTPIGVAGGVKSATEVVVGGAFCDAMRAAPTITLEDTSPDARINGGTTVTGASSTIVNSNADEAGFWARVDGFTGLTAQDVAHVNGDWFSFDAEL